MASGRVKIVGYAQRRYFDQGIEYRNFTDELVGQQMTTPDGEGLPYSLANIFDTEFNNEGRLTKNFVTNNFSQFITLADIDLSELKVTELIGNESKLYLNLDETKFTNYAYFGSLREFIRVSLEHIILTWPASIFLNNIDINGYQQITVEDYFYDVVNNISTFKVNVNGFTNPYNVNYTKNGLQLSAATNFRSLTLAYVETGITYGNYNISASTGEFNIIGFTGATQISNDYTYYKVVGDPFLTLTSTTYGSFTYHIKPNEEIVEAFFNGLNDFEYYLLNRYSNPKYKSTFSYRTIHEAGNIVIGAKSFIWPVSDGYNLDFQSHNYVTYVSEIIEIADGMDESQTDILTRFLVAESITSFDSIPTCDGSTIENEGQKITKTLRIYGREFDEIKKYIDGIAFAHSVSYDKKDNIPDGLVKNFARTLGWDLTETIFGNDLASSYLAPSETLYSGYSHGMSAFQSEIEFWRRIIINTPWIWKSKGARKAVEFLIKIIGTPEGLIDFNEYIYVAQNQIDMEVFKELLLIYTDSTDISQIPITEDGWPSPLPDTPNMYFQNDGLWYRETAGSASTLDKLIGNNPHIGPYDGGGKYMDQFNCLIPNFTGATLIQENVFTAATNLFINYNGGTFNDIFSYDPVASCFYSDISINEIYDTTFADCWNQMAYTGTTGDCTISGDWAFNLYIDGNLSYNGNSFFTSIDGSLPSTVSLFSAIETAAESLGLIVSYEGKVIKFVQKAGFELCEPPNLFGKTFKIQICIDYNMICGKPVDFTGNCKSCYVVCETEFEEVGGSESEVYIGIYDVNNSPADNCYEITTEGIIDPFPAPEITECGCDESGCDNALRICIREKESLPNTIDNCNIKEFTLDENGLVLFNINGQTTYLISPECCNSLGFESIYNTSTRQWECRWAEEIIPTDITNPTFPPATGTTLPPTLTCDLEIYSINDRTGLVTFLQGGNQTTITTAECCRQFGFTPVSVGDEYNCYNNIIS